MRMLCGLCLVGGFAACQKVDLPSEEGEDTEQSGQTGDKPGNEGHEPGGADEAEDEVPLPPEYEGAWTVAGILSEYEGVDLDTDYEEMVVGYIVGACDRTMKNALFTIDEIRASGVNSNVLIADSKDERDASRCMPIELKKGTDVREEANLVDNPEVLGRRIGLLGLVKTYFKVVGLKNVAYHGWLTNGGGMLYSAVPENRKWKSRSRNPKNRRSQKDLKNRKNQKSPKNPKNRNLLPTQIRNRDRFRKIR